VIDAAAIDKARLIVEAALDLKAENVVALDISELSSIADVFVIVSGRSDRHVRAVSDGILASLRGIGEEPLGVEGQAEGRWVLIDADDAVIHVFDPEAREEYDLERLWSDADTIDLALPAAV
jgi:ribosome-associated protein